jgi:hypothetical protein
VLREWALPPDLIADAKILVSELMTNARAASVIGGLPSIALRLLADPGFLMIEAWDQSPYDLEPFSTEPFSTQDDAESGRGLMIVAALSTRWGSRRTAGDYKVVWAELAGEILPVTPEPDVAPPIGPAPPGAGSAPPGVGSALPVGTAAPVGQF